MRRLLSFLTLGLSLAFALAPLWSDFAGFSTSQLPYGMETPYVQPAGYAFAIWGPIYLWLIGSAIYGVLKPATDATWHPARRWLAASLAIGVPWLWIASQSPGWATVTIWAMMTFAILALSRTPSTGRWWLRGPVALYAGWLTAASFVSLAVTLAGYGVLLDNYGWAFPAILGALAVSTAVYWRTPAPIYLLAVIWALIGICVTNWMQAFLVTATALTGIAVLICVMAIRFPDDFRG